MVKPLSRKHVLAAHECEIIIREHSNMVNQLIEDLIFEQSDWPETEQRLLNKAAALVAAVRQNLLKNHII